MLKLLIVLKKKFIGTIKPTIDAPLKQVIYIGTIVGIYFPNRSAKFINLRLFYLLLVIICIQCLYVSLEIVDAYASRNSLDKFTQNFCLTFTHCAGIIKILNLLYRRNEVAESVDLLKCMIKKYAKSDEQKNESLRAEKELTLLTILFISMVTCTTVIAIVINGTQMIGSHFPFCVYLPRFMPNIAKLVYCSVSVLWNAYLIVIHDCLIIGLMIYICSQLEILIINQRLLNAPKEDFQGNVENVPFKTLYDCIEHHQLIIRLTSEVESLFSDMLLLQFFTSLVVIGLTGFQITISHNDSIAVTFGYLNCIFVELFIYCWYANQVIEKSNALGMSGYFCPWYNYGCKFIKTLSIFIMRAQIPLNLTAGGFYILSLDTFSQILSRSYSYMALLRQLYDDQV